MKRTLTLIMIPLLFLLNACDGGKMAVSAKSSTLMENVPESAWKSLSTKKIFFGHQSVGNNIVEGLKDVLKERPQIKLNIVETSDPQMLNSSVFAHYRVGKNQDPLSKNEDFARMVGAGIGGRADFAFFKYCYIDIQKDADVSGIFLDYKKTMESLKAGYPNTVFIHVTVPLTVVQTGPRTWIKTMIGRPLGGHAENIRRNEFNDLLRREYGKEPVFDLAKIESGLPDGASVSFTSNGKTFDAMAPEYASDGRHLNEKGRRIVAEKLLIFLADLAQTHQN